MTLPAELCFPEPTGWKFLGAICHVLSTEYAESQHFCGREFGFKSSAEVAAHGLRTKVDVTLLHQIVHLDPHWLHWLSIIAQEINHPNPNSPLLRKPKF